VSRRAGRGPLSLHRDAVQVYVINTAVVLALIAWSWLTLPPGGGHTPHQVLLGGCVVIAVSWAIAFLVAGPPFHRPARAELNVTPHT
jgi:hypothetical protein